MKKNITIIDYGSGNILSAKQSFARVIKNRKY
jgi:imidazoleglycerol phosphate synthase glutamine amidotransferase subunit HisH